MVHVLWTMMDLSAVWTLYITLMCIEEIQAASVFMCFLPIKGGLFTTIEGILQLFDQVGLSWEPE